MTFFSATRVAGFDVIRDHQKLEPVIARHDLVITGEGCLDRTSLEGKGPVRIAALARTRGVPVWGIFGRIRLKRGTPP